MRGDLAKDLLKVIQGLQPHLRVDPGPTEEQARGRLAAAAPALGACLRQMQDVVGCTGHTFEQLRDAFSDVLQPASWEPLVQTLRSALHLLRPVLLSERSAPSDGWSAAEAAGIYATLRLVECCLRAASTAVKAACQPVAAPAADVEAASASLTSILGLSPGQLLSAALRLPQTSPGPIAATAATLSLLELAARSPAFATDLAPHLHSTLLLERACALVEGTLHAQPTQPVALSVELFAELYLLMAHPRFHRSPHLPHALSPAWQPLLSSPPFGRMLLAGVACATPGGLPPCAWPTVMLTARFWLEAYLKAAGTPGSQGRGPGASSGSQGLSHTLGLSPRLVMSALRAGTQVADVAGDAMRLVACVWHHLSPETQAQAFVPGAALCRTALEVALAAVKAPAHGCGGGSPAGRLPVQAAALAAPTVRGAPVADPRAECGLAQQQQQQQQQQEQQLISAMGAVQFLACCLKYSAEDSNRAGRPCPHILGEAQQQRARWVLLSGTLGNLEALLRCTARAGDQPECCARLLPGMAMEVGVLAALRLLSSTTHAAAALAALHSLAATVRKCWWLQAQPEGVAPTSSILPATSTAAGSPAGNAGAITAAFDWHHCAEPLVYAHCKAGTASAAAAKGVLRHCSLLLLLPVVHKLAAQLNPAPCSWTDGGYVTLLRTVYKLHDAGLGDATAAVGVPDLMRDLMRAACSSSSNRSGRGAGPTLHSVAGSRMVAAAVTTLAVTDGGSLLGMGDWGLGSTVPCGAWRQEVRRLGLADLMLESVAETGMFNSELPNLRKVLHHVRDSAPEPGPSWDGCLLAAAQEASAAGGGPPPFFGCWHRGCTYLDGPSEAALKLRRCSSCVHARYCSEGCQRLAWSNGHRQACMALQQRREQSPGGGVVDPAV